MSLVNKETGQTATPLAELQTRNAERREQTDNALLKEALVISNEKCNGLISEQNTLVKDLTYQVGNMNSDNDYHQRRIRETVQSAVTEMKEITREERNFKAEISQTIKTAVTTSVNEVKSYAIKAVDESVSEVKEELKETANEIKKQRIEMQIEGGFRKFMFWATPILLLAQSIATAFLLLK